MDWETRFKKFKEEYEKLCEKYEMSHVIADKWHIGFDAIEIYDEKNKCFIYDD